MPSNYLEARRIIELVS